MIFSIHRFTGLMLAALTVFSASAAAPLTREAVLAETLHPYAGPTVRGVDPSTLTGKIMCGYQGWFNVEGDGAERGWVHWTKRGGPLVPGNAKIDLWPDVSELTPEERFATGFRHADGRVAEVFSAYKKPTVLRHFEWMRDYGIDGAFVQRFITDLGDPQALRHNNTVLENCREGANRTGRAYALMYDLSGLRAGHIGDVLEDFHSLRDRMKLTDDPAYLRHRGKPLVAVWGVGFSDRRAYTLAECRQLVEALKKEGCAVMLGVPTSWRELTRDALPDPALHELLKLADVVSPWAVGRFDDLAGVKRYAEKFITPDLAWCRKQKLDYLPVVFPGFSWHNMTGKALDQIPRQEGRFLWSQFAAAQGAGAKMIYVAMFDEMDEGTAIFKCTSDVPPPGASAFVSYGGLPSDHYLRLTGAAGKMLRGEMPFSATIPKSLATPKKRAYHFDKTISREVLENYLSRAISVEGVLNGRGDLADNTRMLHSTGAKFIGRSLCLWGGEAKLLSNLQRAKEQIPQVRGDDADMIFQACIFEIVSTQVEQLPVPDWAFAALGLPVEKRNFRYADMLYPDGRRKNQWGSGASVPDVSRSETKLWFYFLAASYLDIGIEAIHFGQTELMNGNDRELAHYAEILSLIRSYAATHARRHMLICDSHVPSGGLVRDGKLLMDFHSFPLRVMEVPDKPQEAILKVGFSDGLYNRSKGGVTPSGWTCEHLPYLVELDNWGASRQPGQPKAGGIWIWGYDEITWFAHQSKEYRAGWLRYADDWLRKTDTNAHLQMPGSRTMRSPLDGKRWYYANTPSAVVPDGLGDEEAIRSIWKADATF